MTGSRSGEVRFLFGTEERTFRLTVARWIKLQELTGYGPQKTAQRLRNGEWTIQELRGAILHGLIGGGMEEEEAELLCRELVDGRGLMRSLEAAYRIVSASLFYEGEDVDEGEPQGS